MAIKEVKAKPGGMGAIGGRMNAIMGMATLNPQFISQGAAAARPDSGAAKLLDKAKGAAMAVSGGGAGDLGISADDLVKPELGDAFARRAAQAPSLGVDTELTSEFIKPKSLPMGSALNRRFKLGVE